MGTQPENFALRWNDFQANIASVFKHLRSSADFQDVSLVCNTGAVIKAHKVILSACSPYFQSIFSSVSSSPHPIIVMPHDVQYEEMMSIVDFMYYGEVGIPENDLSRFLTVAEQFQVRGLVEDVPKVGGSGGKRPRPDKRGETEAESYQPLGSYQPPGLVCPKCRIIYRGGPEALKAHMAVCGQERPVLQVAPSRQRGALTSRARPRQLPRGRGGGPGGPGGPGGHTRRSKEPIKPSQGETSRPASSRSVGQTETHSQGPGRGQGRGLVRPDLRKIGQKLGLAVSITSVAGQASQPDSLSQQPEVKQEPGDMEEEEEAPDDQTAETESERQYPEYQEREQEHEEEVDTGYENQFSEAYEGTGDLGDEYLGGGDNDNYPGYEDYDGTSELTEAARY